MADRRKTIALRVMGGISAGALGTLGLMAGSSLGRKQQVGNEVSFERVRIPEEERMKTFSSIADTYDWYIERDEYLMGLMFLRWRLMRQAAGNVLEVGTGTGRNVSYYPKGTHVTYTDQSEEMLAVTKQKLDTEKIDPTGYRLQQMKSNKLDFPNNTFDTVTSTFGLCSYEDPIASLNEMQRVCKPDGRILLLEHGLGHYSWINRWLSDRAAQHARKFGCVWNKPIRSLIEEAGMKVVEAKRYHFGTTYYYTVEPNKTTIPRRTGTRGVFTES